RRSVEPALRRIPRGQALERRDLLPLDGLHRRHARAALDAVDEHRARAALREAAAEARALELEVVGERIEKRHVRLRADRVEPAVDADAEIAGHFATPAAPRSR